MKAFIATAVMWIFGAAAGCSTFVEAECSKNSDCRSEEYCDEGTCETKAPSGGGQDCSTITDCEQCATCSEGNFCAGAKAACTNDVECVDFISCFDQCSGHENCQQVCLQQYFAGAELAFAWTDCKYCNACFSQCQNTAICGS